MRPKYTFLTALLLISSSIFGGSAALAHDEVASVSPEAGSTVEAGMIDLSIVFNEEILATDGATGFEVVVTNAKGEIQPVGCISPLGNSLGARVAINSAGEYKVDWHSVSSDGHPSEGSYAFNVSGTADIDADLINNCPRLLIAPAPLDDPSAIAYSGAVDAVANDNTAIEIGILVLVVLIVLGAAIWVTSKRKRAKD